MKQRQKPRSYTYRVPLDDRRAVRKINRLDSLDTGYWIAEIPSRKIPNRNAVKNWAVKFYESKEHRDFETDEIVGGPIPGLHKYRYSLEWEPTPESELLEMRHANRGGTKIKGQQFVGTSDPRLPNYAPISTTVPWTPGEITAMFDGEPVPDRVHYTHDPPMIDAAPARREYRELLQQAADDGLDECRRVLVEREEVCDHDHVLTTGRNYGEVAFCEDCHKGWERDGFEYDADAGNLTVVGSV